MAGKTKKRRFGKRLTLFRDAVKKLDPAHRTPHVVTVLGVAMGLTVEKIEEEIGLAAAMFGHLSHNQLGKNGPRGTIPDVMVCPVPHVVGSGCSTCNGTGYIAVGK